MEDLRGIRAGRYKRRETWKQEDQTGKILYEAGMAVGNAMEGLEDVLRELAEEGDYGAAARARSYRIEEAGQGGAGCIQEDRVRSETRMEYGGGGL